MSIEGPVELIDGERFGQIPDLPVTLAAADVQLPADHARASHRASQDLLQVRLVSPHRDLLGGEAKSDFDPVMASWRKGCNAAAMGSTSACPPLAVSKGACQYGLSKL